MLEGIIGKILSILGSGLNKIYHDSLITQYSNETFENEKQLVYIAILVIRNKFRAKSNYALTILI